MKLAILAASAAAFVVAAAPASASTYMLNGGNAIVPPSSYAPTQCFQSTPAGGTCELTDNVAVGSTYQSLYEFQLGAAMTVTASIFTNTLNGITFGNVALYSNGTGNYGVTGTGVPYTVLPSTAISMALNNITLAAGKYTVAVNATLNNPATTVASTFGFAAAVPETATWAMMLVGFGAVGGALRTSRRKVSFLNA